MSFFSLKMEGEYIIDEVIGSIVNLYNKKREYYESLLSENDKKTFTDKTKENMLVELELMNSLFFKENYAKIDRELQDKVLYNFYDPTVMEEMRGVANAIFTKSNNNDYLKTVDDILREHYEDDAIDSENDRLGEINKFLEGYLGFSSGLFFFKVPSNERAKYDIVHDSIIALILNVLRKAIPNFNYSYSCIPRMVQSKHKRGANVKTYFSVSELIRKGKKLTTYFTIENSYQKLSDQLKPYVKYSQDLKPMVMRLETDLSKDEELRSLAIDKIIHLHTGEFLLYYQQVLLSLKKAYTYFYFTHNNLTTEQVVIRNFRRKPFYIRYDDRYLLSLGSIATIVEYNVAQAYVTRQVGSGINTYTEEYVLTTPDIEGYRSYYGNLEADAYNVCADTFSLLASYIRQKFDETGRINTIIGEIFLFFFSEDYNQDNIDIDLILAIMDNLEAYRYKLPSSFFTKKGMTQMQFLTTLIDKVENIYETYYAEIFGSMFTVDTPKPDEIFGPELSKDEMEEEEQNQEKVLVKEEKTIDKMAPFDEATEEDILNYEEFYLQNEIGNVELLLKQEEPFYMYLYNADPKHFTSHIINNAESIIKLRESLSRLGNKLKKFDNILLIKSLKFRESFNSLKDKLHERQKYLQGLLDNYIADFKDLKLTADQKENERVSKALNGEY